MRASQAAYVASARFGLGPRAGELAEIGSDPRGWALQQLAGPPAAPANASGAARMRAFLEIRQNRGDKGVEELLRREWRETYIRDATARLRTHIETRVPFRERLVAFWSNHFTVSVQRPPILGLAAPFENEAIRPHVTGRFHDMLLAVARHPAMLTYLDQAQSIGPNSRLGQRRARGLNENLAREILELHTLGVDGGYAQADVRAFANILTGWSLGRPDEPDAGAFRFRPEIHEPGTKTLLGHTIAESGSEEGLTAFYVLSRHPATARFVAKKLARQFVADDPPPHVVEFLARLFRDTGGDLGVVSRALVDIDECWDPPLAKVRTPNELVVGYLRAASAGDDDVALRRSVATLAALGQPVFGAPSPAGWADRADQWIGPESAINRAELALAVAQKIAPFKGPEAIFEATIASVAGPQTREAILRAPSAADGLGLLFASAEFQRR